MVLVPGSPQAYKFVQTHHWLTTIPPLPVNPSLSNSSNNFTVSVSKKSNRIPPACGISTSGNRSRNRKKRVMAENNNNINNHTNKKEELKLRTVNHLRHVESMATLPSGAGNIPHLNAVILGESLASEENDLIFPSDHFSSEALVPSPQKVSLSFYSLPLFLNLSSVTLS